MDDYDDMSGGKKAAWAVGGCGFLLLIMAISTLFMGGLTYLVVNVMFGGDFSFWACCGIGLVLGMLIGGGSRR